MKSMRRLMRDRVSAGAVAVLIAYLCVIQAAFTGFANGAMAASAGDPLRIICSQMGALSVVPGDEGQAPAKASHDCPCATLCRLASAAIPAILDGPAIVAERSPRPSAALPAAFIDPVPPALEGLIGAPRAPPFVSA
jgi:hypothetical protein